MNHNFKLTQSVETTNNLMTSEHIPRNLPRDSPIQHGNNSELELNKEVSRQNIYQSQKNSQNLSPESPFS